MTEIKGFKEGKKYYKSVKKVAPYPITENKKPLIPQGEIKGTPLVSVIVTCWMGWLVVDRGFPENADPSRIYLGTDTHAMGLLLGASLGALLNSTVSCSRPGVFVGGAKFNSSFLDALGLMCFGILCTLMQVVNESNQFLYLGGFLLTSTASILLILSVADGRTKCGRVLSRQPFRWVGQRSYGLYLWH